MASKKTKPSLPEQLAATDTREPQTKVVKNAIRRLPAAQGNGFTIQVLPAGLGLIRRMARKGASRGSIAHSLGISLEKFNQALQDQPEVLDALTAGLSGLEDELTDILLEHARNRASKFSFVAACYLTKARCGWREGDTQQVAQAPVIINLPGSQSMEDWQQSFKNYQQAKGQLK
jgi:hypothetical protein